MILLEDLHRLRVIKVDVAGTVSEMLAIIERQAEQIGRYNERLGEE